MTARCLCKETYPIRAGSRALVYAAAGGTGQILLQWIKHLGGVVIAVVSTEEKAKLCKSLGADHTILSSEDIAARVAQLGGKVKEEGGGKKKCFKKNHLMWWPKVDVVYDSVGKDTFVASLDSLRPRGTMVSYGNASGPVPEFKPLMLAERGSLFLTRPRLHDYIGILVRSLLHSSDSWQPRERSSKTTRTTCFMPCKPSSN